jgi:hypothetical protein
MPLRALLVVCLLAHALWAALEPVTGADFWWGAAAGRWIVRHGTVPSTDVLSYTFAGKPWFNQEWLTQVVWYGLHEAFGGTSVALWKIALVVATFVLAAAIATRRSGSLALAVVAACAAALVCRPFLDVRAQLYTFLLALVVLAVLQAYRRGAPAAVLALVPLTVALWVNLHYGFVFGVATCLLYAGTETARRAAGLPGALPRGRLAPLWAAAAAAVGASLLNPQGLHALTFPFSIVGQEAAWREQIVEWGRPVLFGPDAMAPRVFGPYLLVWLAPRRLDPADTLLAAATAGMALTSRRFVPLFALVATPFLARNLALVAARLPAPPARRAIVAALAALALAHVAWRGVPAAQRDFAPGLFAGMTRAFFFPAGAVEFLDANRLPARLYHLYTWAGYLLYLAPERRVFIDGRAHAVYPIDFWHESFRVERGAPGWDAVLDRYGVSLVLWPTGFAGSGHVPLREHLRASPQWVRVYDDNHSAVFAHAERAADWVAAFRAFRLHYPDTIGAQLFLYDAMVRAGELERAREHLVGVLDRHANARDAWRRGAERHLAQARATDTAGTWFHAAFALDAVGDRAAAVEAYERALALDLPDPYAGQARAALVRLGASAPTE